MSTDIQTFEDTWDPPVFERPHPLISSGADRHFSIALIVYLALILIVMLALFL